MVNDRGQEISESHPDQTRMMDYDAILSQRRELTPSDAQLAGDFIETGMKLVKKGTLDKKTGFQTAYLKARKIIERKVDTNGNIFYAMIRDFDPKGKKDLTGGLVVSYFETDTNEELIGEEELLTFPRHRSQVKQPFVSDLEDKNMDWQKLRGVTASLNKTPEFITKEKFETLEHKLT